MIGARREAGPGVPKRGSAPFYPALQLLKEAQRFNRAASCVVVDHGGPAVQVLVRGPPTRSAIPGQYRRRTRSSSPPEGHRTVLSSWPHQRVEGHVSTLALDDCLAARHAFSFMAEPFGHGARGDVDRLDVQLESLETGVVERPVRQQPRRSLGHTLPPVRGGNPVSHLGHEVLLVDGCQAAGTEDRVGFGFRHCERC